MGFPLVPLLVVISGYFYITYTLNAVCSSGFSGPSCHKENLALNRSTTQSSNYSVFASKLAVDGNTNKIFDSESCAHTANDGRSSWSVLLDPQKEHNITNVTLYLRDRHPDRYKDLRVTVDGVLCGRGNITNTNDTRIDATPSPNPVLLRCHEPLRGHNVTVHVNNGYLALCEVQIWVCEDGWFGDDCSESCRCNNTSEVCDKLTGYCRNGCSSGWEGRGCQIACTDKTYGPGCSLTCGQCLNSSPCDPFTGLCSGCDSGWETGRCDRSCSNNTYGPGCSLTCGQCLNSSPCDPVTGSCSNGSDPGWRTQKCDEITIAEKDVVPYLVWAIVSTVLNLILLLAVILLILRRHHQNTSNNQEPVGDVDMIDTTQCNQYEDLQTRGQDNPYRELDLQNKSGIEKINHCANE